MKVLFISEYYPPQVMGGGEINLAAVAKGLAKIGVEVLVLTSFFPGLARYEEQDGVKIYRRLKTGTTPSGWLSNVQRSLLFPRSIVTEVEKLAREITFDLIHCTGTSIIAAARLKKLNKPLLATIESYPALCPKGDRLYHGKEECKIACSLPKFLTCQKDSPEIGKMKNRWYLKYNVPLLLFIYGRYRRLHTALRHCHLISISRYVQGLLKLHQLPSRAVIPNIIEGERFRKENKKLNSENAKNENSNKNHNKNERPTRKPRIIYLGALIESKGPQILLEALKGIECRCDLYGEGTLREELLNLITKNNLDAEIHPLVPPEEVPALYAQADLIVFPSLWPEPFGRIALEAQASGVPLIASATGAIPELIIPGQALLVEPGNEEELRQAIVTLLVQKGREITRPNFKPYSTKAVSSSLYSLYRKLVFV